MPSEPEELIMPAVTSRTFVDKGVTQDPAVAMLAAFPVPGAQQENR